MIDRSKQRKWDKRFLILAEAVSLWSKDPSTGVGCILVDPRQRVISLGFNGLPRGVEDRPDRLSNREVKLRMTLHAEENAVLFALRPLEGATCYTWPLPPCAHCASKLIQAGISRVVAPEPPADLTERWGHDLGLAYQAFAEAGVRVDLQ